MYFLCWFLTSLYNITTSFLQWKDHHTLANVISFTGTHYQTAQLDSYSCSPSHAHEEDLPGTVNLQALEGDDTGYGQALYPVPSEDPNDPLQWSNSKKTMILIIVSLYSFLGNSALIGPSVYLEIYAEEFGISVTEASGLVSYPNLVYGFGMSWSKGSSYSALFLTSI